MRFYAKKKEGGLCFPRYGGDDLYAFAGDGMFEAEACGVEVHPVCGDVAIEAVSDDGTAQAIGVGTMNAKLVGTACQRKETN